LYTAERALFLDGEKLAKFGICGKMFDELCTFWRTKNVIFGGKILWSIMINTFSHTHTLTTAMTFCVSSSYDIEWMSERTNRRTNERMNTDNKGLCIALCMRTLISHAEFWVIGRGAVRRHRHGHCGHGHITFKRFGLYMLRGYSTFYRAMHFSAKRGIAIACRPSVCPSVCNVGGLWSHRLEFFENNFTVS